MNGRDADKWKQMKEMLSYLQKHHRTQEAIMTDIQQILRPIKERSLMVHVQTALASIAHRDEVKILEGVASPMRQMVYLVDMFYATENRTNQKEIDSQDWKKLTKLLNEIEMSYFLTISGFEENGFEQQREKSVSLATFIQSYSNPRYAFNEQVLERIQRHFAPFEKNILDEFGFCIDDIVRFLIHVEYSYNQKYTNCMVQWATYLHDSRKWRELTKKFDERGIPPEEWANQPELKDLAAFGMELGSVFVLPTNCLYDIDIERARVDAILSFLTYRKDVLRSRSNYYTETREYTARPFILIGDEYICPYMKFSAEAVYDRLNEYLLSIKQKSKYVAHKAKEVEKKVKEVLDMIFTEDARRFTNYSIEPNIEQDLLYEQDGYCFIIEVKDYSQRSPRINPYQSYTRINDDFKRSIQKGYEQCRRVEKALMGERDVVIYDSQKCNKIAGVIKSDDVKDCFTIVVTRDSYAYIQTDLSNLLQKESEAHYPWSVGIDDLEAFVLLMKKLKKGKLADVFSEYLDFRERYNGHLMCFDELELAGYFFVDKKHFEQYADNTNYFATNIRMSQIFDAHYACGLGFRNELNMDVKSEGEIPRYERKFAVHNYSIV